MKKLVQDVYARLAELADVSGDPPPPPPNPPATVDAICRVEERYSVRFPEDYRAFLLLHNGWPEFSGENALLSTGELLDGPILKSIREYQLELKCAGETEAASGLVFEASHGTRIAYFNFSGVAEPATPEVVYSYMTGEGRYPSFMAYLEGYRADLDEMIANERANLR